MMKHVYRRVLCFMLLAISVGGMGAQPILPGTYVTSLNWSADGSLLAYSIGQIIAPWGDSTSQGGVARVIERNGTTLFSMSFPFHTVYSVELSPSGNLVLIGSFSEVYNVTTQERVPVPSDGIAFIDGTWHPTSDLLLLTAFWGTQTYNPITKQTLSGLGRGQLPNNPSNEVQTITSVWSPNGLSAATSTSLGSIFIWDTTSEVGTVQTTFSAHTAAVQRLVWNAETNLIASGDDSGKIWVWNPATGEPVTELVGHVGAILALDWRSDGQQLVSSGIDGTIRVWDWPSGTMQLVSSDNIVSALAYNPDGTELTYAGEVINPNVLSFGIVPVQSLVQPIPTATPPAQPILPGTYVTSLNWGADGSLLAYGTGQIIPPWGDSGSEGGAARVMERTGTIIFSANFPYSLGNVEVSPSGNLVYAGSSSYVFNLSTQELVVGPSDSVAFIDGTWHPNSDFLLLTLVLGAWTYDPVNRDVLSGLSRSRLPVNSPSRGQTVTSVWSPEGMLAATSNTLGSIFVWDTTIEVATVQTTFSAHTVAVQRLVWNAETNLIASGDDSGKIWVWNPATGEPVTELVGHVGAILALDWRSDGQQLVSSGIDGTVRVWDWPSGAVQVVASGDIVSALAYSPDGTELAYAGEVTDPNAVSITIVPVQSLFRPTRTASLNLRPYPEAESNSYPIHTPAP